MDATVVSDRILSVTSSITRPSNTTAYAAGDVLSDTTGNAHHTFSNVVRAYGPLTGSIETAIITTSANQTTLPDLELWLFDADIATVADNAAFAPTDAESNTLIGIIAFPVSQFKVGNAGSGAAGNAVNAQTGIGMQFSTKNDTKAIYGQLVVRNAYTPVSAEIFTIRLFLAQD